MERAKLPDQSGSTPDAGLLTVGSLFSGIGGFELGFEATGRFKSLWQVECDKYASKILEKHWPDVHRHDDVCTWPNETTEPVDVLIGGFPCQDISYAGKGAGLDGERSGLFYELMRIVRVVGPNRQHTVDALSLVGEHAAGHFSITHRLSQLQPRVLSTVGVPK